VFSAVFETQAGIQLAYKSGKQSVSRWRQSALDTSSSLWWKGVTEKLGL